MIKLSSGKPIQKNKEGSHIFLDSKIHTILLLLLYCRPKEEAEPDEMTSPWRDRRAVREGRKSKTEYVREIYEGIDLVPVDILEMAIQEMLDSDRTIKPSLREIQIMCTTAMRMKEELNALG